MKRKRFFLILLFFIFYLFLPFCKKEMDLPERSMDEIAIEINGYFMSVGKRLITLKEQIQSIMNKKKEKRIEGDGIDRFKSFDNTVYYNPKVGDGCAFWYSGDIKDTSIQTKFSYYERFEKYIKNAAGNEKYSNSVFMISGDNFIISYPYVNFRVYLTPDTDFKVLLNRNYKKYKGDPIWTNPYLDVMGTGYVTSLSDFILKDEIPLYQITLDVAIPELYKKTINKVKIPMMILKTPVYIIAVNKKCREIFNIKGGENKFYLKDEKVLSETRNMRALLLDKKKNLDLFKALNEIEEKSPVFIESSGQRYKILKKKINATGWFLLSFIKT